MNDMKNDRSYCCVPQCKSKGGDTPRPSFHKFPPETRFISKDVYGNDLYKVNCRNEWVRILKMGKKVSSRMSVCSKHFTDMDYLSGIAKEIRQKKRLKVNALPSKNLPVWPTTTRQKLDKEQLFKEKEARRNKRKRICNAQLARAHQEGPLNPVDEDMNIKENDAVQFLKDAINFKKEFNKRNQASSTNMHQETEPASSNQNWTKEEISVLIALYQSESCLYDQHHPQYNDLEEHNKAYERIQKVLTSIRSHHSVSEIKAEIQSLYSKYVCEKNHKDKGILKGEFTKHSYKPILWCFGLLEFLDEHIVNRYLPEEDSDNNENSTSNFTDTNDIEIKKEVETDTESDTTAQDLNSTENNQHENGISIRESQSWVSILKPKNAQNDAISIESSEREDIFGEYVASEIRALKANTSLYLQTKRAIVNVLTNASFEYLKSK